MKNTLTLPSLLLSLFLVGCGDATSVNLIPPPQQFEMVELEEDNLLVVNYDPKLDILFVLDNSRSMENDFEILRENIGTFVEEFSSYDSVNFHIGVTTVFDSKRYTNSDSGVLKKHPKSGQVQYLERGELKAASDGSKVIRRDNIDLLDDLFDIETPFVRENRFSESTGSYESIAVGPETEESFSPVIYGLGGNANPGFHRPDSHLVVIFLTDAEDSTPHPSKHGALIEPTDVAQHLLNLKGGDVSKLSVFGVLCRVGDKNCRNLKRDGISTIEDDSNRIRELIQIVDAERERAIKSGRMEPRVNEIPSVLNLKSSRDPWGAKLAQLGNDIRKRVLEKKIKLPKNIVPEIDTTTMTPMISVAYGDEPLPYDREIGWTYEVSTNTITLHPDLDIEFDPETKFNIKVKKVNIEDKEVSIPL